MSLPYRQTNMYRGLHKARSVKPKGTYKRRRGRTTVRIPRGNQFANQLGGLMKLVPTTGKASTACHWEGFTNTGTITITDPANAFTVLSFQLADSNALSNAVNVFMRYKITEATLLIWPQNLPASTGTIPPTQFPQVSAIVAPFKQVALSGVRAGTASACGALQGAQYKVLNSTQDVLRCRIFNPRPGIDAGTGTGTTDFPVYMPTGPIACTTNGEKIPHYGFAIGFDGWFPNNPAASPGSATFGYKIALGVTFYGPRLNNVTAVDIEDKHPVVSEIN